MGEVNGSESIYSLPRDQDAILLLHHYFATIGQVLPYVENTVLLSQYAEGRSQNPPKFRRAFLVLLNAVWALALSSLRNAQAEKFYQRAIALLDQRCLRGSNVDLG
jgi:hypothetical protein